VVDTDAEFPIEAAKSELRDALNSGDMDRLLSFYSDEVVDLSEGRFTRHGECAKAALRSYLERLFENFHVNLVPIVWRIRVIGEAAHDLGWHKLTLVSKHVWREISSYIDDDVEPTLRARMENHFKICAHLRQCWMGSAI